MDLVAAAPICRENGLFFSFASDNELAPSLRKAAVDPLIVRTFAHGIALALTALRLPIALVSLIRYCRGRRIGTVVNLMPHLWTGVAAVAARCCGLRWTCVVHEATRRHPGDWTGLANWILRFEIRMADRIVALSNHVRRQLDGGIARGRRVTTIPLYALGYGSRSAPKPCRKDDEPVRFLFFGRIMRYKGLDRFVSACEALAAEGRAFSVGVVGNGRLGSLAPRLQRLNAMIENRWIAHEEVGAYLSRFDVVVVPAVEASQSGVVATAHGCGMPAIVTPVGGMVEQVRDGVDGLVCADTGATAVAAAMRRVIDAPGLLQELRAGARLRSAGNGPGHFLDALLAAASAEACAATGMSVADTRA